MQILSSGGPPLVFQGGQVFQFHWQVASLGIHQDSSGQGNFGLRSNALFQGWGQFEDVDVSHLCRVR